MCDIWKLGRVCIYVCVNVIYIGMHYHHYCIYYADLSSVQRANSTFSILRIMAGIKWDNSWG